MSTQTIICRNLEQFSSAKGFLRLDWARDNNIKPEPQQYMLGHIMEVTLGG